MLHGIIRRKLAKLQNKIDIPLTIVLWDGSRFELGKNSVVTLTCHTPACGRALINPSMATLGTLYVEGKMDIDGPLDKVFEVAENYLAVFGERVRWQLVHRFWNHSRKQDAKDIQRHYDVSNDFYALWLDPDMAYSCAYFRDGNETLEQAQQQKFEHICRKLRLKKGDKLLDIGCGWGGLIRYAVKHYGVDATGVTLSKNQLALAQKLIKQDGLEAQCRVALLDYRDIPGKGVYDKIVSVGMFEHVGLKKLPTYFGTVSRLLKDDGVFLNHGITSMSADSADVGSGIGTFVHRYVFPHGELPHISLALDNMARQGLESVDVESLRMHYAKTTELWVKHYEAKSEQVRALVDEKTWRIWRVYLAGCAYGFAHGWMSIHQIIAGKQQLSGASDFPWTREYIYQPAKA